MVEQSIFINNNELRNWINNAYDLGIDKVERTELGSANCYYLYSNSNERYFLKEFQKKITYENLEEEIKICKYLNERGITTSSFICNREGKYISSFRDRYIHVQKYIIGNSYNMFEMPNDLMIKSARFLGRINKVLSEYKIDRYNFGDKWFNEWSNEKEIEKLKKLLDEKSADIDTNSTIYKQICEDFEFKINMLKTMDGYADRFLGTYKCSSHGDYSLLQILCDNNDIVAIIDFASACTLPPTWEIIRSYSYASKECRNNGKIDFDNFTKYLDAYLEEYEIPKIDILRMPSLYYFNLIRSSFGYKQYLKNKSDKNLNFAFWRTKMCRWLYNNMDEFEAYLDEYYKN